MKKLIAVLTGVASVGVFTALGLSGPTAKQATGYQPKPTGELTPHVMQVAGCTPTSSPGNPGGNPRRPGTPPVVPPPQNM